MRQIYDDCMKIAVTVYKVMDKIKLMNLQHESNVAVIVLKQTA